MKQSFGRRIATRLSYANVMSTLALFLALGGISYAAATLPKNSVGTKQIKKNGVTAVDIKKNAVTSAKIKPNAVLSSDVKNDTLSGDDINESTLATVPSATTAGTASDQFSRIERVGVSASHVDTATARASATKIPLASHGQVSIYGKCFFDIDSNWVISGVYAETTAPGSLTAAYSQNNDLDGNPSLSPATPETSRNIQEMFSSNASADYDYASGSSVIGADGRGLMFDLTVFGQNGPVADPGLAHVSDDGCMFHVTGSKSG